MRVVKLKHLDSYLERLHNFARAMGITVISNVDVIGQGEWLPSKNRIKIDQGLLDSELIATFLHELGHALDDISTSSTKLDLRLAKAYYAVYNKISRKSQLQLVLNCEKRAWQKGRIIAKNLKIRLGKWYDEEEADCLSDYRKKD
jgi:hypothetical protein